MKALVIIDVQKGMFADLETKPHDGTAIVGRLSDLLIRARNAQVSVFFVQHDGGADSPLASDSPGFAFHGALTPLPDEDITVKKHCSSFQGTGFHEKLIAAQIDHVIIGGMQSEYCIDTAVRGAFERGLKVTLIADGHTTFDTPVLSAKKIITHHNHTLGGGSFAEVVESEVIASLLQY